MARTAMVPQLLSLFSYRKLMCADRADRTLTIWTRFLWFIRRKKIIPFDLIKRIDYAYTSLPTKWSLFFGTTDEMDWFKVSLELHGDKQVSLFSFFGEGSVETGLGGVIFGGDQVFDFAGDQEGVSGDFVDLLKAYTGKTLAGGQIPYWLS